MDIQYIHRREDEQIAKFIEEKPGHKPVLLVEGPRQVGKTWLVQHALQNIDRPCFQINLERDSLLRSQIDECSDFSEFEDLLQDRIGFRSKSECVLFIDEAQESRNLGRYVRFMKEEWEKVTTIFSGSTLRRLFRPGIRYPVGRVRRLTLWPFSFSEFLRAAGKDHLAEQIIGERLSISGKRHQTLLSLYDQYLRVGGLPAIVRSFFAHEDFFRVRAQIIADYEQDLIRIFGEEDIDIVKACWRSVANFVGSVSKNTTVVPAPGNRINARINEVFARLENWHLIIRSDQKGPSPEASHNYLPKRYLFDTGVLRHIRETALPSISVLHTLSAAARTPLGGILENQTAIDLRRFQDQVTGWKKTSSGAEIDFILKRIDSHFPLECKATLCINKRHMRGVLDYLDFFSLKNGIIVSLAPMSVTEFAGAKKIINMPAYLLERLGDSAISWNNQL